MAKSKICVILAFIVIAVGTGVVMALDPPHDASNDVLCLSCHVMHNPPGPSLTKYAEVNNLCKSCHYELGDAIPVETHGAVDWGKLDWELGCTVCHNPHEQEGSNIHLVKEQMETLNSGVRDAIFTSEGSGSSFVHGDPLYDGVCETCHTETSYHRNSSEGSHSHYTTTACTTCHVHANGFGGHGDGDCAECHGDSQSHLVHIGDLEGGGIRGPNIGCGDCHDTGNYPSFTDGNDLEETNACDACHSPGGTYNGVNSVVDSIGAKDNWDNDIYSGSVLASGMEKWCVGCHDDDQAAIGGVDAPDTSLFWTAGHGRANTVQCEICHDTTRPHIDGEARTYAFNSNYYSFSQSGISYAAGYRLNYVGGETPLMIPANYNITFSTNYDNVRNNAFRLCFECHSSSNLLGEGSGRTNFRARLPNPPRNYSYGRNENNEHFYHILNMTLPDADSDWDHSTRHSGPGNWDTMIACFACHNVHGASGIEGSTNEAMIRDGTLAGRNGYGFSYVTDDPGSIDPWMVTSTSANQSNSVGSIFRYNTGGEGDNAMCGGEACHNDPAPPSGSSYDARGSGFGSYLEYFRELRDYGPYGP
ncbi:cytochrome c3 family protein [Candidatus Poribacteria bacterium]